MAWFLNVNYLSRSSLLFASHDPAFREHFRGDFCLSTLVVWTKDVLGNFSGIDEKQEISRVILFAERL